MNIIGICGRSGSGKSTTASLLRSYNFEVVAFADALKRSAREMFGFTNDQCWGALRDVVDVRYGFTPRHAFQHLGTEVGRAIYENVWVDHLMRIAGDILDGEASYSAEHGLNWKTAHRVDGVAVGDVRFLNEARAIVKAGGRLWMCSRDSSGLTGEAGSHVSELGEIPLGLISVHIDNNGTKEALKAQVQTAMLKRAP
jgi:hypothetical protein